MYQRIEGLPKSTGDKNIMNISASQDGLANHIDRIHISRYVEKYK